MAAVALLEEEEEEEEEEEAEEEEAEEEPFCAPALRRFAFLEEEVGLFLSPSASPSDEASGSSNKARALRCAASRWKISRSILMHCVSNSSCVGDKDEGNDVLLFTPHPGACVVLCCVV